MNMKNNRKKKKSLDEVLQEALRNAPVIQGYTIEQIKEILEITVIPYRRWNRRWHIEDKFPWRESRWHFD